MVAPCNQDRMRNGSHAFSYVPASDCTIFASMRVNILAHYRVLATSAMARKCAEVGSLDIYLCIAVKQKTREYHCPKTPHRSMVTPVSTLPMK